MELRHLRYFAATAELLHFSRAAARLHLTQPALSRQIRDLESELGVRLFLRHGMRTELTDAGRRFLTHARDILERAERAVAEVKSCASSLRFGHYGALWTGYYSAALRAYAARFPKAPLEPVESTPSELVKALRQGEVEVALLGNVDAALRREFGTKRLGSVPAILALGAGNPLAKRRQIPLRDLAQSPWVVWDERAFPGRVELLRQAAAAAGFEPRIQCAVDSVAAVFMQVSAGLAVGYVLPMSRNLPHDGVVFSRIKPPGIEFEMHVAWRKNAEHLSEVKALVELLAG